MKTSGGLILHVNFFSRSLQLDTKSKQSHSKMAQLTSFGRNAFLIELTDNMTISHNFSSSAWQVRWRQVSSTLLYCAILEVHSLMCSFPSTASHHVRSFIENMVKSPSNQITNLIFSPSPSLCNNIMYTHIKQNNNYKLQQFLCLKACTQLPRKRGRQAIQSSTAA